MISLSDNEAANELVRYLSDSHDHRDGMEKVNDFIEEHDFTDTHQYNGLEDSNLWYGDEANVTSVKDCGRFLEEIYDGDMVSHLASRQLEGYLLNQDITWKIRPVKKTTPRTMSRLYTRPTGIISSALWPRISPTRTQRWKISAQSLERSMNFFRKQIP